MRTMIPIKGLIQKITCVFVFLLFIPPSMSQEVSNWETPEGEEEVRRRRESLSLEYAFLQHASTRVNRFFESKHLSLVKFVQSSLTAAEEEKYRLIKGDWTVLRSFDPSLKKGASGNAEIKKFRRHKEPIPVRERRSFYRSIEPLGPWFYSSTRFFIGTVFPKREGSEKLNAIIPVPSSYSSLVAEGFDEIKRHQEWREEGMKKATAIRLLKKENPLLCVLATKVLFDNKPGSRELLRIIDSASSYALRTIVHRIVVEYAKEGRKKRRDALMGGAGACDRKNKLEREIAQCNSWWAHFAGLQKGKLFSTKS